MKHLCNLFLVAAGLLFYSATTTAQESPPWYDIELIIFSQTAAGARTSELWPEDAGRPELNKSIRLQPAVETESGLVAPYTLLPKSTWKLQAEFDQLKRNSQYNPLLHLAWHQPVVGSNNAQPVYLRSGSNVALSPRLEGAIKVSVSRYLHVNLDLMLLNDKPSSVLYRRSNRLQPAQHFFRLKDTRRMRSGELHYIDHPMMGALILISRYEPAKPAKTLVESLPKAPQPDNQVEEASQPGGEDDKKNITNKP